MGTLAGAAAVRMRLAGLRDRQHTAAAREMGQTEQRTPAAAVVVT